MGRTYRDRFGGSTSVHFDSEHQRNSLPKEKKASHHRIRNDLKKCDDQISLKMEKKLKYNLGAKCNFEMGNIPNSGIFRLHNIYKQYAKWSKQDGDNLIDNLIEQDKIEDGGGYEDYFKKTKK